MKTYNSNRKSNFARMGSCLLSLAAFSAATGLSVAQTDPAAFTAIREWPRHGAVKTIVSPDLPGRSNVEVDEQSIIRIGFDTTKMTPPGALVTGGPARPRVHLRVEVYSSKGPSRSPIAPIPHYADLLPAPAPASSSAGGGAPTTSETTTAGTIVYHDKYFNPAIGAGTPDTEFNLAGTQAGAADFIEIRVTNLMTQESLTTTLIPQRFGFHAKITDSLMFVKRLGVNNTTKTTGVEAFNFGPSPGVTYGGTYLARGNGLVRFLQPGFGVNVLFTKWSDPAFDASTGLFVAGTKASDIQTGIGPQVSLFGNVLQFTYGWNLHAEQKRQYFGIGVSFVNMATKLTSLVAK